MLISKELPIFLNISGSQKQLPIFGKSYIIIKIHLHVQRGSSRKLLVRMGEHDLESTDEPHPHVDRYIQRIFIHPKYSAVTYDYDLALLKLNAPVDFALHLIPICLPEDGNKLVGRLAWAKGYGYIDDSKELNL